jgi:predicted acylesterase/phospholipase RssA
VTTKIALCLPGGGAMGALYQVGALAAIEDAVDGFDANSFDLYVGSSVGASLSATLAAGLPVQRLYRAFLDPADVYFGLERKHLLRIDLGEWRRTLLSALAALGHAAGSALSREAKAVPAALWQELDRLYDSLPAGLFTLEGYEKFLDEFFVRRGVPKVFGAMPKPLRVLAHDLDTGMPVCFGGAGFEGVPLARACIASMAVPPFFSPVKIGDRHYFNPGAGLLSPLDVAAREGANVIVVVNSMVPIAVAQVPTGHGHRDSLRDKGMMWVLNQALRIGTQRLIDESYARLSSDPSVSLLRIEPTPEDGVLFLHNAASFEARRKLLEHGYTSTRRELGRRFAESDPALLRTGLRARPPATRPSAAPPP